MNRLLISLLVACAIVIDICSASPVPVREELWRGDDDIMAQDKQILRRRRQYDVDGELTPPSIPDVPESDPDEPEGAAARKKRESLAEGTVEVAPDGKPAHEDGRTQSKSGYGIGYPEPTQGAGEVESHEEDETVARVRRDEEAAMAKADSAFDPAETSTTLSENDEATLTKTAGDMGVDKTRRRRQWTVDDPVTDEDETRVGEPQDAQRKRRQSMVDDEEMDEADGNEVGPAEPPVDDNEEATRHVVEPRKGVEMDDSEDTSPTEASEEKRDRPAVVEDAVEAVDEDEETMESDDGDQTEGDTTNLNPDSSDTGKDEDDGEAAEDGSFQAATLTDAEDVDEQEKEDEMTASVDDTALSGDIENIEDDDSVAETSASKREVRTEDGNEETEDTGNSDGSLDRLLAEEKLRKEAEALLVDEAENN